MSIQTPLDAYTHARTVLKGRWPEAESVIVADSVWYHHYQEFLTSLGETHE